jgi:hypothetical protein
MFRVLNLSFLFILVLSGCAASPEGLGISENEWQKYSKAKQEKLLADYKKMTEENETADNAMKGQYADLENSSYNGKYLQISISDGEAMMPPFTDWYAYKEATFEIIPDSCTNVNLEQITGENKVALRACFKKNVLFLDPSHYDAKKDVGTVRFVYSPLWDQGFTYRNINTSGYVKLKDVTVTIQNQIVNKT